MRSARWPKPPWSLPTGISALSTAKQLREWRLEPSNSNHVKQASPIDRNDSASCGSRHAPPPSFGHQGQNTPLLGLHKKAATARSFLNGGEDSSRLRIRLIDPWNNSGVLVQRFRNQAANYPPDAMEAWRCRHFGWRGRFAVTFFGGKEGGEKKKKKEGGGGGGG